MRRGRIFIYLAFIIIIGLVLVYVVWQRFIRPSQQVTVEATPTPQPVEIVALAQPVTAGTPLDAPMMMTIPWQQSAMIQGMFPGSALPELVGRVPKFNLEQGTPLLDSMLLKQGETIPQEGSPWALSIPKGMVAVSIPVSRLSSVSYAPRPGDHVNVIVTLLFVDLDTDFQTVLPDSTGVVIASGPPDPTTGERNPLTVAVDAQIAGRTIIDPVLGQAVYLIPNAEGQRPRMVSQMLLQDVVVLQMGEFPLKEEEQVQVEGQEAQPTPEGQQAAPPPVPEVVTLIVRPQDAVSLNYILYAQNRAAAQLSLALRGANDDTRENILPVTLQFLLEQYQIPVPARLPYSLSPRIDSLVPPSGQSTTAPAQ